MSNRPSQQPRKPRSGSAREGATAGAAIEPHRGLVHALLAPVRGTRLLLAGKIRFQRRGLNVHVVLGPAATATPPGPDTSPSDAMRMALKGLLNEKPENRQVLRHLVYFETAFKRKGLRALSEVPVDVLQRALDQFEMLVKNWSHESLAELRSKMSVALVSRGKLAAQRRAGQAPSEFHVDHKVTVEETSVSRFMAIHQDWQQSKAPAEAKPL